MRKRIIKARVKFLSLVPRGAAKLPVMYKSEGDGKESFDYSLLTKAGEISDQGEVTGVVYAPDLVDSQNECASEAVIREMMHSFAKEGHAIDIRHDSKALDKDQVYVAENFTIQKGDPRFMDWTTRDGKPVDVTGGWGVVLKIDDPELRKLYREKNWELSMGGEAARVIEKSETVGDKIVALLEKGLGLNNDETQTEELDMNETQVKDLIKAENKELKTELLTEIGKLIKGEGENKPPETKEEKAPVTPPAKIKPPVLKAGASLDDLKKHQVALKRYAIESAINPEDPESVAKGIEALEKFEADNAGDEPDNESQEETNPEKAELQRKLRKAQARSNQASGNKNKIRTTDNDDDEIHVNEDMSKEDQDLARQGAKMARLMNKQRGMRMAV